MNSKKVWVLIVLFLVSIKAFSQVDSTFSDTIEEIVIYEYDTVYVAPDTIRLVDTIRIVNTIVEAKKKDKIKRRRLKQLKPPLIKPPAFLSPFTPSSLSLNAESIISVNHKKTTISDSLSSQPVLNMHYSLRMNYEYKKTIFVVGIGISPYHEKYEYERNYYISNYSPYQSTVYDSVLITERLTHDYYFDYFNLDLLGGGKFELNRDFYLTVSAGFRVDYLIHYEQGNTNITDFDVREWDISFSFSPQITYRFSRYFEFYLSSFYQYSILHDEKMPYLTFQKIGIGLGINFLSQ